MTKKKVVKEDGTLKLKTRQPGKVNKNYFGDFKSRFDENVHPLDEMFPTTAKSGHPEQENLDTQREQPRTPGTQTNGHPQIKLLDTQSVDLGHSTDRQLSAEALETTFSAPKNNVNLGAEATKEFHSGHSKNSNWRKYEKSRSSVRVNLHVDKEIDKRVRQYCLIDSEPKIELKEFYERAALTQLELLDTQRTQNSGAGTPFDDRRMMLTSKSKASLINLYLIYNSIFNPKSKWTVRDDEAGARFNDADIRIVELGIIQTHFNRGFKPGKINSFQYYVNQIEEMQTLEFSEETLEAMIRINRSRWEQSAGKQLDLSFLNAPVKK